MRRIARGFLLAHTGVILHGLSAGSTFSRVVTDRDALNNAVHYEMSAFLMYTYHIYSAFVGGDPESAIVCDKLDTL